MFNKVKQWFENWKKKRKLKKKLEALKKRDPFIYK
jgi:hypothetical protein|tara:strand:- start:326 stop:430 length:105 start_codon:yes stop_codon:yes gene_type:complete